MGSGGASPSPRRETLVSIPAGSGRQPTRARRTGTPRCRCRSTCTATSQWRNDQAHSASAAVTRTADPATGSACESMLMHQVGHSRAQIMQDVQAGSINRIHPCDPSRELMYAADAACRRPPTRLPPPGPARAARHRDLPKPQGPGRPEAPNDGDLARHRAPLAPWLRASSSQYAPPAPHPCAAEFPRTPD